MSKRVSLTATEHGELELRLLRREATAVELEASNSGPTLYQWSDTFLRARFVCLNTRFSEDVEKRRHAR